VKTAPPDRGENQRSNRLQLLGYVVLRFTYDQLAHDPATVAAQIREALIGSSPPMRREAPA
jgi:very-short-patch-repair endonuclease